MLAQAAGQAAPAGSAGGDGAYLAWALALLAVALALFVVEMFVPSGGLIGLLSALSLIGGIVLMFWEDTAFGLVAVVVVLFALPFAVGLALKVMPSTPFIRALTLGDPDPGEDDDAAGHADAGLGVVGVGPHDHPLVGKTGKAVTNLRPVGVVVIEGRREECLAHGGMIESGQTVRVVSVDGMQIKVKAV